MKPRSLLVPLALINIAAVLIGLFYYGEQLAATAAPLIIFVPDCPLYVLLFLLVALKLVRNDAFAFLVSAGMVKYGLWTVFVLLFHWGYYSEPAFLPTTLVFIAGHLGMAAEGLAVAPKKRIGTLALAAIVGWFLLNDFADYSLGTAPPIPPGGFALVAALTIASSFAIPLALHGRGDWLRGLPLVSWLAKIAG